MTNCWAHYPDERLIAIARKFADPGDPDRVIGAGYRDMYSELARRLGQRDEEEADTKGCPENTESRDNWAGSPAEKLYLHSKRMFKAPSPNSFESLDGYVARVVQALEDHVNGQGDRRG